MDILYQGKSLDKKYYETLVTTYNTKPHKKMKQTLLEINGEISRTIRTILTSMSEVSKDW